MVESFLGKVSKERRYRKRWVAAPDLQLRYLKRFLTREKSTGRPLSQRRGVVDIAGRSITFDFLHERLDSLRRLKMRRNRVEHQKGTTYQ